MSASARGVKRREGKRTGRQVVLSAAVLAVTDRHRWTHRPRGGQFLRLIGGGFSPQRSRSSTNMDTPRVLLDDNIYSVVPGLHSSTST